MDKKLQGKFMGCPYHGDDYESCIEYSGQAPCDPPEGWKLVPMCPDYEMATAGSFAAAEGKSYLQTWEDMLAAAPKWGGE